MIRLPSPTTSERKKIQRLRLDSEEEVLTFLSGHSPVRGSPLGASSSAWGFADDGFGGRQGFQQQQQQQSASKRKTRKRRHRKNKKNRGSRSPLSRSQSWIGQRPNTSPGFSRHQGGGGSPFAALPGHRRPHSRSVESNRSLSPTFRSSPVPFEKEVSRVLGGSYFTGAT